MANKIGKLGLDKTQLAAAIYGELRATLPPVFPSQAIPGLSCHCSWNRLDPQIQRTLVNAVERAVTNLSDPGATMLGIYSVPAVPVDEVGDSIFDE